MEWWWSPFSLYWYAPLDSWFHHISVWKWFGTFVLQMRGKNLEILWHVGNFFGKGWTTPWTLEIISLNFLSSFATTWLAPIYWLKSRVLVLNTLLRNKLSSSRLCNGVSNIHLRYWEVKLGYFYTPADGGNAEVCDIN